MEHIPSFSEWAISHHILRQLIQFQHLPLLILLNSQSQQNAADTLPLQHILLKSQGRQQKTCTSKPIENTALMM